MSIVFEILFQNINRNATVILFFCWPEKIIFLVKCPTTFVALFCQYKQKNCRNYGKLFCVILSCRAKFHDRDFFFSSHLIIKSPGVKKKYIGSKEDQIIFANWSTDFKKCVWMNCLWSVSCSTMKYPKFKPPFHQFTAETLLYGSIFLIDVDHNAHKENHSKYRYYSIRAQQSN